MTWVVRRNAFCICRHVLEKIKQVVTLDDSDSTVLLTCWPDRTGKATFDDALRDRMLMIHNVKVVCGMRDTLCVFHAHKSDFASDQRGGYSLETVGRTQIAEVPHTTASTYMSRSLECSQHTSNVMTKRHLEHPALRET